MFKEECPRCFFEMEFDLNEKAVCPTCNVEYETEFDIEVVYNVSLTGVEYNKAIDEIIKASFKKIENGIE